jgi:hypothetical protein
MGGSDSGSIFVCPCWRVSGKEVGLEAMVNGIYRVEYS